MEASTVQYNRLQYSTIQYRAVQYCALVQVLTIAHRIKTILDSDRVLVLEAGAVQEFASPASLLANQDSAFASMARDAGIVV